MSSRLRICAAQNNMLGSKLWIHLLFFSSFVRWVFFSCNCTKNIVILIVDDNKKVYKCIDLNQNIEPFVCRIENDPTALRVKMTLRSAARPSEHSRGTQHTLAFHLGHSRVTCGSLQLHLLFTCSSFIKTSLTWGSLGQQGVQWVIYIWQIRVCRPASTKHSPILWISEKALPILVISLLLELSLNPSPGFEQHTHCLHSIIAVHCPLPGMQALGYYLWNHNTCKIFSAVIYIKYFNKFQFSHKTCPEF